MRRLMLVAAALPAAAVPGCGGEDVERGLEGAREEFERRRDEFGSRIREVLAEPERVFEQPERTSPVVRSRGRNGPVTIEAFLTGVLGSVDRYWTRTFEAAGLPERRPVGTSALPA